MSIGSIYKIEFPNGKKYIGLTTTSLKQRKEKHKSYAKNNDTKCLCNAIRKYKMIDTFELIEIDKANTIDELYEKEIEYIKLYNSYYKNGKGYNMTYGGDGTHGYIFTEEDKLKISEGLKQNYEEHPELIQKLSDSHKKFHKENPDAGKEHGQRMIQYYIDNPEAREKVKEKSKEQWGSLEARKAQSDRKLQHFENNPEAGKEHGEKMKQLFKDNPELIKKILDGKGKNKPFDVSTIDGKFIKTFNYQCEARKYLQKEHKITTTIAISNCLNGKRNNSAGFVFKYK